MSDTNIPTFKSPELIFFIIAFKCPIKGFFFAILYLRNIQPVFLVGFSKNRGGAIPFLSEDRE